MNNQLYWIIDLLFALMVLITKVKNRNIIINNTTDQRYAFESLTSWVVFFCFQDMLWGICSSSYLHDKIFFFSSTLFHISTVFMSLMWLRYIFSYLNVVKKIKYLGMMLAWGMIMFQFVLLSVNIFTNSLFHIDHGIYVTSPLRNLLFVNQYIIFLGVGILTLYMAHKTTIKRKKKKFLTVFVFALAPIVSGFFQYKYTYAPFHAIGYFISAFLIYVFIISDDQHDYVRAKLEKEKLENQIKINAQINIARTDELTGIKNRRAYMAVLNYYEDNPIEDDFIYMSIDVNGLKIVNDNFGHSAGDELIIGAAQCLKKCIEPYGSVFRLGGDEFAAIMHISDENTLEKLKQEINKTISSWKGKLVDKISISLGTVAKCAHDNLDIKSIINLADDLMYQEKQEYYLDRGIDRKGQSYAYNALCRSYQSIIKMNLSKNLYRVVYTKDKTVTNIGKCQKDIGNCFTRQINVKSIHTDDLPKIIEKLSLENLNSSFKDGTETMLLSYRKKYPHIGDTQTLASGKTAITKEIYHNIILEIVPAEDFTSDNRTLYFFEKIMN